MLVEDQTDNDIGEVEEENEECVEAWNHDGPVVEPTVASADPDSRCRREA
jgi:hypothetical protein